MIAFKTQSMQKFLTNFSKFAFEGIGIIIITFIGLIIFSQKKVHHKHYP